MRRTVLLGVLLGLAGCLRAGRVSAAAAPSIVHAMVPMSDGTRLATDVCLPAGGGPWPVALARTPYGKKGVTDGRAAFIQNGMVLVAQDVRGRFASEGKARPFFDDGWGEHPDGADTVGWIRQQPWCNGKIATFGASYLGIDQLLLAGTGAPGIVGQSVYFGAGSIYHDVFFQSGVWRHGSMENWLSANAYPQDVMSFIEEHASDDALWATLDFGSRPEQARWPIVLVGGWFDLFTQGTLDAFTEMQDHGGAGAQGYQHLVIGPWVHSDDHDHVAGQLVFPQNADWPSGAPEQIDWLGFWLTGRPSIPPSEPAVRYYVMGDVSDPQAPGNVWRTADHWPPPSLPTPFYFTTAGGLDPQPAADSATREYDYDPAHPVPTVGGPDILQPVIGSQDQRRVETRPDVLVFTTPPLPAPVEVTGRITVRLYAITSAQDTDFTAKLTDVYPNGRSMLITDGIVRASLRQAPAKPGSVTPGQQYAYDIDLGSTSLIFNRGHQIRVAISSSNYPRFEKNPNTGARWPYDPSVAPVVGHQTISLGGKAASCITLPVVAGGGMP